MAVIPKSLPVGSTALTYVVPSTLLLLLQSKEPILAFTGKEGIPFVSVGIPIQKQPCSSEEDTWLRTCQWLAPDPLASILWLPASFMAAILLWHLFTILKIPKVLTGSALLEKRRRAKFKLKPVCWWLLLMGVHVVLCFFKKPSCTYHVQLKIEGNDHIERALPQHRAIEVRNSFKPKA